MLSKNTKKWKRGINIDKKKIVIFFWMIFCIFFVGYLVFCNVRILQKREELSKSIKELDNEIASLTKNKETLSFDLGQTNDPEYIERIAREDLGMQKSGEQVVVIKKNGEANNDQGNSSNNVWDNIVNWFNSIREKILPE